MEFKKLKSLKSKYNQSIVIAELEGKYKAKIKKPRCDKYSLGFEKNDRHLLFSAKVNLCGCTGYYGDSSCGALTYSLDSDFMTDLLIKTLNENFSFILQEMARIGMAEAKKGIEESKIEIESALNFLSELESGSDKD